MKVGELKKLLENVSDHHEILNENGGQVLVSIEVAQGDLPRKGERKKLWLRFR